MPFGNVRENSFNIIDKDPVMNKPNIIFIFSDQQRWDTMGCYGQKLPVTPNLDALAAEGVRFENAFTCQPVCGPARAALQTGKWATQTGCFINGIALPTTEKSMAHYLSDAGYEVGYIGKWHLASTDKDPAMDYRTKPVPMHLRGGYKDFWIASDVLEFTSHGYDGHMFDADGTKRVFPEGRYRADAQTDFIIEYLSTRELKRPFYLFTSFIEPHHQNDHNRYEGPLGSKEKFAGYEVPGDLAGTQGDWRENYPDYLGCCNAIDANVGRIVAELKRRGIYENTLIIYTSDHGTHFKTRNAEYKRACHDGCLRIPFIAHGPGFTGGEVKDGLVSLLDATSTVLASAGVTPQPYMAGKKLQDLVAGGEWRDAVYAEISEDHIGRAMRTKKWKYEIWVPSEMKWSGASAPGSSVYHEYHLYDLENDPHEKNDLVGDKKYSDVRAMLAEKLAGFMVAAGESVPKIVPAASR